MTWMQRSAFSNFDNNILKRKKDEQNERIKASIQQKFDEQSQKILSLDPNWKMLNTSTSMLSLQKKPNSQTQSNANEQTQTNLSNQTFQSPQHQQQPQQPQQPQNQQNAPQVTNLVLVKALEYAKLAVQEDTQGKVESASQNYLNAANFIDLAIKGIKIKIKNIVKRI